VPKTSREISCYQLGRVSPASCVSLFLGLFVELRPKFRKKFEAPIHLPSGRLFRTFTNCSYELSRDYIFIFFKNAMHWPIVLCCFSNRFHYMYLLILVEFISLSVCCHHCLAVCHFLVFSISQYLSLVFVTTSYFSVSVIIRKFSVFILSVTSLSFCEHNHSCEI
jgi:hypothetical protein